MSISGNEAAQKAAQTPAHNVIINNRERIVVGGVMDVPGFDANSVLLITNCGNMAVEGSGLRVKVLDTKGGNVEVEGKIDGVLYYDKKSDGASDKKSAKPWRPSR